MAKKADAPIYDGSNVIPFVRREKKPSHSNEKEFTVEEYEVDVLMCSLCGSNSFHLLADMMGQIGCSSCGFLIGATWSEQGFVKHEE
jgi:ribosomal protein L37E